MNAKIQAAKAALADATAKRVAAQENYRIAQRAIIKALAKTHTAEDLDLAYALQEAEAQAKAAERDARNALEAAA